MKNKNQTEALKYHRKDGKLYSPYKNNVLTKAEHRI
jgi:hypothetical protein